MNEEQLYRVIEYLLFHAEQCRKAQWYYFKNRNPVNLRIAKAAETKLDEVIKYYKRKGIDPEKARPKVKQAKLL